MGKPVVIGGDNLPSSVGIGLTDLPNIEGASGPPAPPFWFWHHWVLSFKKDKYKPIWVTDVFSKQMLKQALKPCSAVLNSPCYWLSIVRILICIQFFILFIIMLMIVYILEDIWRFGMYLGRIEGRMLEKETAEVSSLCEFWIKINYLGPLVFTDYWSYWNCFIGCWFFNPFRPRAFSALVKFSAVNFHSLEFSFC